MREYLNITTWPNHHFHQQAHLKCPVYIVWENLQAQTEIHTIWLLYFIQNILYRPFYGSVWTWWKHWLHCLCHRKRVQSSPILSLLALPLMRTLPHKVRFVTHLEECSPGVDYEVWIDLLELQGTIPCILTVACLNLPLSSAMSEACLFLCFRFLGGNFANPRCESDSNCGGGSFKDDHNENVCTIKSSDC